MTDDRCPAWVPASSSIPRVGSLRRWNVRRFRACKEGSRARRRGHGGSVVVSLRSTQLLIDGSKRKTEVMQKKTNHWFFSLSLCFLLNLRLGGGVVARTTVVVISGTFALPNIKRKNSCSFVETFDCFSIITPRRATGAV